MPSSLSKDGLQSSDSSESEMQTESLVAGRQRRSRAGALMSSLIAEEETLQADGETLPADGEDVDDLTLLFAGEGEDMDFNEDEADAASDVEMDSSSDDDQGPTAGADDLDGEKDIEREAREERRKKRKAQEVFKRTKPRPPKTTTDQQTGALAAPPPRFKKKSERVSWLPTPEEGPVRQSSRKQTVQNKQIVHQRMREGEKRRKQQLQSMEAAAKRKEASKPKAMTQEDRLAEAAKTEARNAKSLNRWEASEEKRVEEQRAKIAALKNRTLEGPVISWWSGPAKWVDGKLACTGKKVLEEEPGSKGQGDLEGKATVVTLNTRVHRDEDRGATETSSATVPVRSADGDVIMPDTAPPPTVSVSSTLDPQNPAQSQQFLYEGFNINLPFLAPAPSVAEPPVTEIAARSLVILNKIDNSASRIPELQDHVLLRKKERLRPISMSPVKASFALQLLR